MTTISDCYIQCSGSFSRLIKSLGTSTGDTNERIPLKGIVNEYSRFDVWAGSVGAKHVPHKRISLDYRLRDSSFYAARVVDILQRLNSTLNTAEDLIVGNRPLAEAAQAAQPKLDRQGGNDSDRSSITSSAESSSSDEADMMTPERQITALYESITNSVRHLYSLAMVIRQPVAVDRLSRASKITVDHFLSVDQRHVDECFPDSTPVLKKRLANAITRRRQLLIYNEQHYQRSSGPQPTEATIATEDLAQNSSKDKGIEQNIQPPLGSSDCIEHPAKERISYAPTLSKSSLMASTEATKFIPPVDMREEPDFQSESGTISTFGFNGKDRVGIRVPPRPQDNNGEALEQFLCPLCYHLIEVKSERAWMRHVFRDLQAYMCTFDNCENPDVLFETRQDWVRHEFENHRREWHCNDPKHDPCNSETEFITHMKGLHELQLPEPELLSLAKLCERSSSAEAFICPLCKEGSHDVSNGFQSFKPSWIMRPVGGFTCPESYDSERLDMAKLPEEIFSNTTENIFPRVTHWVASLPNENAMQGDLTSDSPNQPQQMYPTIGQKRHCYIPSSDFKRHVGQHLERLALFALNRSKFMINDGKSAYTEDAIARSETSFESLKSFNSATSDENHGHGQVDPAATLDPNSKVDEIGRLEARYQKADHCPIKLQDTHRLIRETLIKSEFEHRRTDSIIHNSEPLLFSPEGSLESIITVESVLWAFCSPGETPSSILSERLKSTVTYTLERGKKLLSISILIGFEGKRLQQAMHLFRMSDIWDDKLPIRNVDLRKLSKSSYNPSSRKEIEAEDINGHWSKELTNLWDRHTIDSFCNNHQWKFCAPIFCRDKTSEVRDLHTNCILPFVKKCYNTDNDSCEKPIKYMIHERHLESNNSEATFVTVIRLSFKHMSQRELVKLERIQALEQVHIVKLITTFCQGDQDVYFISEASNDGNLRDLWETYPRDLTASLVRSVTEQLHGLANASLEVVLTTGLMEGPKSTSSDNLSPENILWFKNGSMIGHDIGTLKTCHQSAATGLVSGNSASAQLYWPPEHGFQNEGSLWTSIYDPDDMWAMGCIILEFMIWLLYGCTGLNSFHSDLKSGHPEPDNSMRFWQRSDNGIAVNHVVLQWMGHMAKDPVCITGQTALGDLLKLTRDRLLVIGAVTRSGLAAEGVKDDSRGYGQTPVDTTHRSFQRAVDPAVDELWNDHRERILQMFVQEKRQIKEIQEIMKAVHKFDASTRQYMRRLEKWALDKKNGSRRGVEEAETGTQHLESIKRLRARPKEVSEFMHRILTGAKNERYWLPCAPLSPIAITSDN